jgi:predicted MFS family arabinose efflux permease
VTERERRLPPAYWRQWTASASSNVGDGMNTAAMPLLAYSLSDDSRVIALVSFASFLPWFLLALPVGVYVDRLDRRTLMIGANVVRSALFVAVATTAATGTLTVWLLLILLLVVGCCEVVFDSSAQAFLPALVRPDQLPRANGVLFATEVIGNGFIGLPIGAWLWVAAVGVPFGVNAAALALAAALVASIRLPPRDTTGDSASPDRFLDQLRDGLRWLRRHRLLRTLAIMLGLTNMAHTMGTALLVKFAAEELGVTASGYGVLLACMSIGAIVGGFGGDRIGGRLGERRALLGAYAAFGLCMIGFGLAPSAPVLAVVAIVEGVAGTVWNVITVSMRQRVIPTELFGRVNSAYRWIGTGSIALGALVGGQIAHGFGLRAPFFMGAAITFAALAFGSRILSAEMRQVERVPAPPSIT